MVVLILVFYKYIVMIIENDLYKYYFHERLVSVLS